MSNEFQEQPYDGNVTEQAVESFQEDNPSLKVSQWNVKEVYTPPPVQRTREEEAQLELPHGAVNVSIGICGHKVYPYFPSESFGGRPYNTSGIDFPTGTPLDTMRKQAPALLLAAMEALCADLRAYLACDTVERDEG
jgi:hypothetical protein